MTKLASALKIKDTIRVKSFELAGHTFKVKVPLNKELEEIVKRIVDIPQELIDSRLKKMTENLTSEPIEGIEVKDGDVIVEGKSTKDTVIAVLQMERRIVEYIKLLVPESGSLENITYEEIEEEFPLQVQLELMEKITEAIQPGYKDARKN
jgi:hypothetical protein